MINIKHLLKVTSVWISIVYVICYAGVAIWSPVRMMTMRYTMHADVNFTSNYFGFWDFIFGLLYRVGRY